MSQIPALHVSLGPLPLPLSTYTQSLITRTPNAPHQAQLALLKSQLLNSDYTTPHLLDPSSVPAFPSALLAPSVPEAKLPTDVHCQVIDLEDLSRSRWEVIEELERIERGEMNVGRAVVRIDNAGSDNEDHHPGDGVGDQAQPPGQAQGQGQNRQRGRRNVTHRLALQDRTGRRVYALELTRIPRIGVGVTRIGEKILLKRGCTVARGMVLLEPTTCMFLGGQIEGLQKRWVEERLKVLREMVGAVDAAGP